MSAATLTGAFFFVFIVGIACFLRTVDRRQVSTWSAYDPVEARLYLLADDYAAGRLTIEELEERIDKALRSEGGDWREETVRRRRLGEYGEVYASAAVLPRRPAPLATEEIGK